MFLVLIAVGVFGFSGLLSLLAGRNARLAGGLGVTGAFIGCAIGLIPAIRVLVTGAVEGFRCGWSIPFGSLAMELDALTAFFLVPILLLSALAALYGSQYMSVYSERKSLGPFWFFYQLLVAGMVMVVVARNGLLFLMAWEIMSLASFFLVTFESEEESVCRAGWTYLVATHIGTAFLLVLFLLLGVKSGAATLDFDRFTTASAQIAPIAGVLFLLAVAGFGTKAGFIPLHVWLPEAHPAAPSHVSALMSGVMIKT